MDLVGIEPTSENLFIQVSPITVTVLTFPPSHAQRHAYELGSFIILPNSQSFELGVPHLHDAGDLSSERLKADSCN